MTYRNHPVADYRSVVDTETQFIDVREPDEVASGSIDGAINIPLGDLPNRLNDLQATRDVVVLCRSGGRSAKAAELLWSAGFRDVINLEGGMIAYEQKDNT